MLNVVGDRDESTENLMFSSRQLVVLIFLRIYMLLVTSQLSGQMAECMLHPQYPLTIDDS